MRNFGLPFLIIATALSGCSGQFVPMQTIDKVGISAILSAEKIQIVSDGQARAMYSLGEIAGHSCQNKVWVGESPSSRVGAIDQLKIVAAQRGAVAITEPQCESGGLSFIKNCWNSWKCKATALRK